MTLDELRRACIQAGDGLVPKKEPEKAKTLGSIQADVDSLPHGTPQKVIDQYAAELAALTASK